MKKTLKYLTHLGSLVPLVWLGYDFFTRNLSVNPIQELTLRTGKTALILLLLSLAITPVKTITGWNAILPLRKLLGLYSALYATVHFSIFVGLDYFFSWELISQAVAEKPFVMMGFAAFLILTVLAVTSTAGWKRRLKKRWKPLHRAVYFAGIFVVVHFLWSVKSDIREPVLYAGVLTILLLLRLPPVRRAVVRLRSASGS